MSKQEEEATQVKVQTAEPESDTAQLRTQAAESQRMGARSPQQALPEMAVSGSRHQAQDVEHGSADLMTAHHPPRPKVCVQLQLIAFVLLRAVAGVPHMLQTDPESVKVHDLLNCSTERVCCHHETIVITRILAM